MDDFDCNTYNDFARIAGLTVQQLRVFEGRFFSRALEFKSWIYTNDYLLFCGDHFDVLTQSFRKAPTSQSQPQSQPQALPPPLFGFAILLPPSETEDSQMSQALPTPPTSPGPTSYTFQKHPREDTISPFPSSPPEPNQCYTSSLHRESPSTSPPHEQTYSPKNMHYFSRPSTPPVSPVPQFPPKPSLIPTPVPEVQHMSTRLQHPPSSTSPHSSFSASKGCASATSISPSATSHHVNIGQQVSSSPPPLTLYGPYHNDYTPPPNNKRTNPPEGRVSATVSPLSRSSASGDGFGESQYSSFASTGSNMSVSSFSSSSSNGGVFSPRPSVSDMSPQTLVRQNSGGVPLSSNPMMSPLAPLPDAPSLRPMLLRSIQNANATAGSPPPLILYDPSSEGQLGSSPNSSFASTTSSVSTMSSRSCSSLISCEDDPEFSGEKIPPDSMAFESSGSSSSKQTPRRTADQTPSTQIRHGTQTSFQLPIFPHRPDSPSMNQPPLSPQYTPPRSSVPPPMGPTSSMHLMTPTQQMSVPALNLQDTLGLSLSNTLTPGLGMKLSSATISTKQTVPQLNLARHTTTSYPRPDPLRCSATTRQTAYPPPASTSSSLPDMLYTPHTQRQSVVGNGLQAISSGTTQHQHPHTHSSSKF
ncbi:hypothetical protein Pelo_2838 [Pelomyxa schiedti]|nr:hypothetical protein Pelo_2838 [Pelomyxa schiedti]